MPLDPHIQAFLEQLVALEQPPMNTRTPEEARQDFALLAQLSGPPEPVHEIENRVVPGPAGDIPIRIYTPEGQGPFPVLVYYHGGGWVIGSVDEFDANLRILTNITGWKVVSVEYRLAPEHPFPAAAEDCYAATRWVAEHAAEIGGDPARIAIGGDSAGGNLTAVVALMARDRGGPRLVYQVMLYPVTDHYDPATASYTEHADGYLLTRDSMVWFWDHYYKGDATSSADTQLHYAFPLRAKDLRGLPPALVITAEYDPLRDEGEAYGARLREAGVPTTITRYMGMIHGFVILPTITEQARAAMFQIAGALQQAITTQPTAPGVPDSIMP